MLLNQAPRLTDLRWLQAEGRCQLHARFDPELRFSVGVLNVDVDPPFFAREEVEPKALGPKNCRTHGASLAQAVRSRIRSAHCAVLIAVFCDALINHFPLSFVTTRVKMPRLGASTLPSGALSPLSSPVT